MKFKEEWTMSPRGVAYFHRLWRAIEKGEASGGGEGTIYNDPPRLAREVVLEAIAGETDWDSTTEGLLKSNTEYGGKVMYKNLTTQDIKDAFNFLVSEGYIVKEYSKEGIEGKEDLRTLGSSIISQIVTGDVTPFAGSEYKAKELDQSKN
jgi:hypothetical protein